MKKVKKVKGCKGCKGSKGSRGSKGRRGKKGNSFKWKGQWIFDIEYKNNDVVFYNGSSYIAINYNIDSIPAIDNINWDLMLLGIPGPMGPVGPVGPQ